MKPKTEIRCSIIYETILKHGNINNAFSSEEYQRLEKKTEPFKKLYKKYINKIISLIEKNTKSKRWKYQFIPIYIVDIDLEKCYVKDKGKKITWKGFGDPVTIILGPEKSMLHTLIHELIHLNIDLEKQKKWGCKKSEEKVHEVAEKAWKELNLGDWRAQLK